MSFSHPFLPELIGCVHHLRLRFPTESRPKSFKKGQHFLLKNMNNLAAVFGGVGCYCRVVIHQDGGTSQMGGGGHKI